MRQTFCMWTFGVKIFFGTEKGRFEKHRGVSIFSSLNWNPMVPGVDLSFISPQIRVEIYVQQENPMDQWITWVQRLRWYTCCCGLVDWTWQVSLKGYFFKNYWNGKLMRSRCLGVVILFACVSPCFFHKDSLGRCTEYGLNAHVVSTGLKPRNNLDDRIWSQYITAIQEACLHNMFQVTPVVGNN